MTTLRALLLLGCLTATPLSAQPVGGQADARETKVQRCVDVRIGTDQAYGCALESLQEAARQAHHPPPQGALGPGSPAPSLGLFNRAATAERLGNAFGHSAYPQRPPPPIYANPLLTARH